MPPTDSPRRDANTVKHAAEDPWGCGLLRCGALYFKRRCCQISHVRERFGLWLSWRGYDMVPLTGAKCSAHALTMWLSSCLSDLILIAAHAYRVMAPNNDGANIHGVSINSTDTERTSSRWRQFPWQNFSRLPNRWSKPLSVSPNAAHRISIQIEVRPHAHLATWFSTPLQWSKRPTALPRSSCTLFSTLFKVVIE